MNHRRLGQLSLASVIWAVLGLAACSSGQTGDAGLGAGAVGTNQTDDDDMQTPPNTTPSDAGADDGQTSNTDVPPKPSVDNPSGDCVPKDNGGRDGYHSPESTDSYLPDCTLSLEREFYRVFAQANGKAYVIPRPDGHPAWAAPCRDEADPLHALVIKYKLCEEAGSPQVVDAINALQPADALTLTHALHEALVFYPMQNGVAPGTFSADILAACESNEALRTGVFEARCEAEIAAEGKPRTEEVVSFSSEEASALAAALNALYGIDTELCARLTTSARETLQSTIEESRACTTDDECVTVGRNSACHDSCEDIASTSAEPNIDAVREQIDAAQCAAFDDAGCVLIRPPCAGADMAQCVDGNCAPRP